LFFVLQPVKMTWTIATERSEVVFVSIVSGEWKLPVTAL